MVVKMVVKNRRRDLRGRPDLRVRPRVTERSGNVRVTTEAADARTAAVDDDAATPPLGSLTTQPEMTRIEIMTTRSLATVKAHFSQVIDEVAGTHERVVVTKNGSPVAVILAVEDYESLMETLEILSDPKAVAEIRDAEARMNDGEAFGQEDIRATLAARRG
jgi:antitoxin YefM